LSIQKSREGYLVGSVELPEAVHEEDLRGCGSDVQDRRAASCQTRGVTAGEEAGCVVVANESAAMQCRAR
jgi:hypothetical protein